MGPLAIDMYLPSLPAIGADLHATASQTQGTVATFLAGMAIGQLFYGPASDRLGRRAPILLGVAIYTLASVACALAASPQILLAGRFVQALGACAGGVVSRAIVRDRFNHTETARMLSLMMLIMGMAPILAPLLGSLLLPLGGWRSNFWVMTAFGVSIGAAAFFRLKESRSEETSAHARTESPVQAYVALLRQPRLVGYALAGALNGAALFTWISSSSALLMGTYGLAPSLYAIVFSSGAVGVIGGNQVNRFLLRRRTPDQVLARACLVALALAALLMVAAVTGIGGAWSVMPALFMLLGSYGFMQGNTMAGALSVDPRRAGAISALLGTVSFGTGAIASNLAGLLHDGTARPMAGLMLAAVASSAASIHFLALRDRPAQA
jgi:DHA1 family bicyclomycin/chloramphenicol resistance-like MFS transporter